MATRVEDVAGHRSVLRSRRRTGNDNTVHSGRDRLVATHAAMDVGMGTRRRTPVVGVDVAAPSLSLAWGEVGQ